MIITEEEALNKLRARISFSYKQKDMANDFGVSQAFISMVLLGQRRMTEPMLKAIGLRRMEVYLTGEQDDGLAKP